MSSVELCNYERMALREELHNLKNCQITFLTTSVTATGVLLGLATTLTSSLEPGIIFLFPLVILLPSWWIFFDKATTITRIVGYYRILEKLILQDCKAANFIGWENALGEFRRAQERGELTLPNDKQNYHQWFRIVILRTSHPYWVVSYYIFLALSSLCVIASTVSLKTTWFFVILVSLTLVVISALWNARIVRQLIHGRNSYDCNEYFWKQILKVKDKSKAG